MNSEAHKKVQAEHLGRNAFLYVRQSTLRQVRENVESSQRQYGLRDRALALGWPLKQIVVIDCDQGQSGSGAVEREGFQKLVTEASMNRADIVMGLEVSRLARNSSDWHIDCWKSVRLQARYCWTRMVSMILRASMTDCCWA
jgi:hypothetical protein